MDTLLYNNKSIVLTTTLDTVVLGGNMRRKRIAFQTNTGNPVFINFGRSCLDVSGNGQGYSLNSTKSEVTIDNPPLEEIHAVASVASTNLTIHEWFTK